MKKYLIIAILILIGVSVDAWMRVKEVSQKWEMAEANVKAYSAELSDSKEKNTALQLTVNQFSYFKDSVLQALDETRKELNIKNKNLKALQSVASSFARVDTVVIADTIFRDTSFALDTLMGDKWYTLALGLKYPSMVVVKPEFKSEKHIVVSSKKETVNPPKKFFLLRWFQRKHVVLHIDVVEKNPYVQNESSKYVEIIK